MASQTPASSLTEAELPAARRGLTRTLFALAQIMYLCFYIAALANVRDFIAITEAFGMGKAGVVALFVTAPIGIVLRLYLLTAIAFDYKLLGKNFRRLFLPVLLLDEMWALSPFLLQSEIGIGLAFAAVAALLYVPFSQRTLIRMAYPSALLTPATSAAK